jgi:malonyl-CoA O-methyltransferase
MLSETSHHHLEKRRVRASFDRSAQRYDAVADLQREIGARLLEQLDPVRLTPELVIDLGAGTGQCLGPLAKRYRRAQILAVDTAEGMLREARRKAPRVLSRQRFVCGDAEALPLAGGQADLLFSNLMLQWCNDLGTAFRELRRVLSPGGVLMFSTFGPDTLAELRDSFASVDGHSHVSRFPDMHNVGDALLGAGFQHVVVDAEHLTRGYPDVYALMRDLKTLGAVNATAGRQRGLTGRRRMQAMGDVYERHRADGLLPSTWEVIYGHAWRPATGGQASGFHRQPPRRP